MSVQCDPSGERIEEPGHQHHQARLAGAARADQGDDLARPGEQVDVMQHRLTVSVGEVDPVETDFALDATEFHGLLRLRQVGAFIEQLEDPPARSHRLLQLAVQAAERAYRSTEDRKSTRLNSSHVAISYAVFCLK